MVHTTLLIIGLLCFLVVKQSVSSPIHFEAESAKILAEEGIDNATSGEKKLARRVVRLEQKVDDTKTELGGVKQEKEQLEEDLADSNLPAAIRGKIEFWEDILAPNYKFKGTLSSNLAYVNYHQEKWVHILTHNVNDPVVIKILDFLKKNGISIDTFATRVAGFFSYTSNKIHFKQVEKLSEQEIETILKNSYGIQDPKIIDLAIFLTKNL